MVTNDQSNLGKTPFVRHRSYNVLRSPFLLTTAVLVAVVLGMTVWGVRWAFETTSRKATSWHFAAVAMSLENYSESRGRLPYPIQRELVGQTAETSLTNGTGRPLYSWRVEIVPYLQSWHGSWDQSKPWDDPANAQLVELSSFYVYDATGPEGHPQSFLESNVLAITGPGTAFGDGNEPPRALKDIPPSTILVMETRASGIPWPAPGDFDIRTMPHTINAPDGKGISSRHAGGFHLIFADGQVWFLSERAPFDALEKFFTTAEAKKNDREELLGPFVVHRGP